MSIRHEVESFCLQTMSSDATIISSSYIVAQFLVAKRVEGWIAEPAECLEAMSMGIAQMVRDHLRNYRESTEANEDPDQLSHEGRPERALIQERYSVVTGDRDADGRPEYLYKHADDLSEDEMQATVQKFNRQSKWYARKAVALEGHWYRNHAGAAV